MKNVCKLEWGCGLASWIKFIQYTYPLLYYQNKKDSLEQENKNEIILLIWKKVRPVFFLLYFQENSYAVPDRDKDLEDFLRTSTMQSQIVTRIWRFFLKHKQCSHKLWQGLSGCSWTSWWSFQGKKMSNSLIFFHWTYIFV